MKVKSIALIGNPNAGKSSLFNQLTGLKQHIGNYPGVTVDKKYGTFNAGNQSYEVIDLPGIYSLQGTSEEEKVVTDFLQQRENAGFPDLFIVVVDSTNLERNLLLFTQLYDLQLPVALVLNMDDLAQRKGIEINHDKLSACFDATPVIKINAREEACVEKVQALIENFEKSTSFSPFYSTFGASTGEHQGRKETAIRYQKIKTLLKEVLIKSGSKDKLTQKIDRLVTHKVLSFPILMAIMFIVFQLVFKVSETPMDWIDQSFSWLQGWVAESLPSGMFTELLSEGIIPGIGGVVIFVPQIALLFFILSVLEETGYMTRVVFLLDRMMRPFGLNGRSIVPLVSSFACAIPGIMAARTIENWKERIITIMVAPFMSCSARLPVYTILIAIVIPDESIAGIFNLKGLVLFGLYLIGVVVALLAAVVFKWILKMKTASYLILEMPDYKSPRWKNVFLTMLEKCKVFVLSAGKIILAISIILWVLASNGPSKYQDEEGNVAIENSFIGIVGKQIEPAIRPLGYDWKIGIGIITSFAAREVFVGTMATIYGIEDDGEENLTLQDKMKADTSANGLPLFSLATGVSLLLFYAFAMQCMSTLAIVYRETKSIKWPIIQFVYMTVTAFVAAWIGYQCFS